MAKFPKEALFEYIFDEDDHDELGLRYVESSPWEDDWPDMVECMEVEKVSITTHEWRRVTK